MYLLVGTCAITFSLRYTVASYARLVITYGSVYIIYYKGPVELPSHCVVHPSLKEESCGK